MSAIACLRLHGGGLQRIVIAANRITSCIVTNRSLSDSSFCKRTPVDVRHCSYVNQLGFHRKRIFTPSYHRTSSYLSPITSYYQTVTLNAGQYRNFSVNKSSDSIKPKSEVDSKKDEDEPKELTKFQKLKKMFKEYWYVLLPVHISTSVMFVFGFYYMAKSGFDIVPLLEYFGVSETILKPLRSSGAGYWAIAYALYKLITPLRYTVTLGGTTITINVLKRWGLIRPIPSTDQMKVMFKRKFKSRCAKNSSENVKDSKKSNSHES